MLNVFFNAIFIFVLIGWFIYWGLNNAYPQ